MLHSIHVQQPDQLYPRQSLLRQIRSFLLFLEWWKSQLFDYGIWENLNRWINVNNHYLNKYNYLLAELNVLN